MSPSLAYQALSITVKTLSGQDAEGNNKLMITLMAVIAAVTMLFIVPFIIIFSGVSALGNDEAAGLFDEDVEWNNGGEFIGGELLLPCPGYTRISDVFHERISPITGKIELHGAIDFAAPAGTNVIAAAGGTVLRSGYHNSYGNYVIIDHGGGIATLYAHLSARCVDSGQTVVQARTIGYVGSTGDSTGNHLHFEVRENGVRVDPSLYLKGN